MKTVNEHVLHALISVGLMAIAVPGVAQAAENVNLRPPDAMPAAVRPFWSPLGLPRLREEVLPGDASPIERSSFKVDPLLVPATQPGILQRADESGSAWLEVEPESIWTRPLTQGDNETHFVSVRLFGSDGTLFSVGGAWLRISQSPIPGCGQLLYATPPESGVEWTPTGMHKRWESYATHQFVSFSVLTVRLDSQNGTWDLYSGAQLAHYGLALIEAESVEPTFLAVSGGKDGAWVTGLVQSSEHPLVEDANTNGIDDEFEKEAPHGLLPKTATLEEREQAARNWRSSERHRRAPALVLGGPRPDRLSQSDQAIAK